MIESTHRVIEVIVRRFDVLKISKVAGTAKTFCSEKLYFHLLCRPTLVTSAAAAATGLAPISFDLTAVTGVSGMIIQI